MKIRIVVILNFSNIKKLIFTVLFFLFSFYSFSQSTESSYPDFIGQSLHIIDRNYDWEILQKSSGDLNKDGIDDLALTLESKDSILEKRCSECSLQKNKARIIVVLVCEDGVSKVIIQNNHFIARANEGGISTPYVAPKLSIENGLMIIDYEYTRSNQSYTFELREREMVIVKANSNGVHAALGDFEHSIFDFTKRMVTSETGNLSSEKTEITKQKIEVKSKSLSEFGFMFDWEVVKDKYL